MSQRFCHLKILVFSQPPEIQFRLTGFGPKAGNADATSIQADVARQVAAIDVLATFMQVRGLFDAIIARADYDAVLKHYNRKGITSFVAAALGLKARVYCTMIVGIVQSDPTGVLATEMRAWIS
jgi:hypothetical protein